MNTTVLENGKEKEENIILVDWFAMSFREKGITVYDVIDLLGLPQECEFKELPGRYYYRNRLGFGNIHILYNHYNPDQDFPMVEMSGQGCREFETFSIYSFDDLFQYACDTAHYHLTRLDVAYDDHNGIFDMPLIWNDYRCGYFVSKSLSGQYIGSKKKFSDGLSIFTGSRSSDMYMRIYDKAFERGYTDGRHWIRCEIVLKQDRAVQFILNPLPLGEKFRGVIHNYFQFVTPSQTDSNKSRWKMRDYWSRFLDDAEKISVFTKKDIDYNLSRLSRYVFEQAGNSIDTYLRCVGLTEFLDKLLQRSSKLNAKQRYLIEQCKLLVADNMVINGDVIRELSCDYEFKV